MIRLLRERHTGVRFQGRAAGVPGEQPYFHSLEDSKHAYYPVFDFEGEVTDSSWSSWDGTAHYLFAGEPGRIPLRASQTINRDPSANKQTNDAAGIVSGHSPVYVHDSS